MGLLHQSMSICLGWDLKKYISIFVRDRQCSACLPGNGKLTVPLFLPGVGISNPSFTSTCIRRSESLWDFTAKSFREWHRGHVAGRVDHKGYGSSITCCHWKLEEDKTCVPLLKAGAEMIKFLYRYRSSTDLWEYSLGDSAGGNVHLCQGELW